MVQTYNKKTLLLSLTSVLKFYFLNPFSVDLPLILRNSLSFTNKCDILLLRKATSCLRYKRRGKPFCMSKTSKSHDWGNYRL